MAKLNTYVENIQLKSNLVDAAKPSASWTASQYPSAKALRDAYTNVHPIGSVICMSTNTNPEDTLGYGTWTLVDKEFTPQYKYISNNVGWTAANGSVGTNYSAAYLAGHNVNMRLQITVTAATSDSDLLLGTLDPSVFGLTGIPHQKAHVTFFVDGGQTLGAISIDTNGKVTLNETVNVSTGEHSMDITYPLNLHTEYTAFPSNMLDSFCNKFYFKRTA